jgi:hypothetical protein
MTRCLWEWIFLQQYVITFCETITKCAHVGLREANKFDFTSAFLVRHMKRCTLTPNLRRYVRRSLLATIITSRFCLLVTINSEQWYGNCHWKWYYCFYAFDRYHRYQYRYRNSNFSFTFIITTITFITELLWWYYDSLLFHFMTKLLLFNWTANGVLPGGSGTAIIHNTQKCTYRTKYHTTLKQNTAHK